MSTQVFDSEYDKVGDFYFKFVHERDPTAHPTIASILSMVGDVTALEICDLACGEGSLTRLLAARGAHVVGIDISDNLLGHAVRQSGTVPIRYIREDAQRLSSISSDAFDVVICNMALMDIEDLAATCRTVHRVLRTEGRFLFSILHPCFETPFNAQHPPAEQDFKGNFVAKRITRYFSEGKWYSDGTGMRGTLGSIHRTLSTYVNTLSQTGFVIRELAEPHLPAGSYSTFREQWKSTVPEYLVAKTMKRSAHC